MKKTILLIAIGSLVLLTSVLLSATAQEQQGAVTSSSAEKNRPVIVAGAVVAPTQIVLHRKARLSESLAAAGDLTKKAKGVVQLIHVDGTFQTFRRRDIKGDDMKANPYLQSGDVVAVF